MVLVMVLIIGVIVIAAEICRSAAAAPVASQHAALPGDEQTVLERAEMRDAALLLAGELSTDEYRDRMAGLASLEASRHPAFAPPRP